MTNALAELYIEQNLRQKVDTTQEAGAWLSERSAEARKKLEQSERALQHFNETTTSYRSRSVRICWSEAGGAQFRDHEGAYCAHRVGDARAATSGHAQAGGGIEGLESMSEVIASR